MKTKIKAITSLVLIAIGLAWILTLSFSDYRVLSPEHFSMFVEHSLSFLIIFIGYVMFEKRYFAAKIAQINHTNRLNLEIVRRDINTEKNKVKIYRDEWNLLTQKCSIYYDEQQRLRKELDHVYRQLETL